jgi:hypothetical protein
MGYGTWLGAGIDPRAKHMLCHWATSPVQSTGESHWHPAM